MPLNKKMLSLDVRDRNYSSLRSPKIDEAIKSTLDQQIRKHESKTPHSPRRSLIARTKQLLNDSISSELTVTTLSNHLLNKTYGQSRRGYTAILKSKRQNKLLQTKRQLQMLNQLYKNQGVDPIKRYQEQIEQEESEIHNVIASYRLRRKLANPMRNLHKDNKELLQKQIRKEEKEKDEKEKGKKSIEEHQADILFEKVHPYRRLLISQRRNKSGLQPWHNSLTH